MHTHPCVNCPYDVIYIAIAAGYVNFVPVIMKPQDCSPMLLSALEHWTNIPPSRALQNHS